ncbi:MAG: hypothetical protein NVSMB64_26280 [Candidatus Velthaea sp.]
MQRGNVLTATGTGPFAFQRLHELWETYNPASTDKSALLDERYLLASEGQRRVYFAPIGAVPDANNQVIVVGLTPGFTQVQLAARLYADTDSTIREDQDAYSRLLKSKVAFGGSMRTNLCKMFDDLGLHQILGVAQSERLFAPESPYIAATSALVYPVFSGPALRNFSGTTELANSLLLRTMIDALLAPRLLAAGRALVVPLGKSVESAIRHLVAERLINQQRVLWDFPHPSGANGHRKRQFSENKDRLSQRLRAWFDKA